MRDDSPTPAASPAALARMQRWNVIREWLRVKGRSITFRHHVDSLLIVLSDEEGNLTTAFSPLGEDPSVSVLKALGVK